MKQTEMTREELKNKFIVCPDCDEPVWDIATVDQHLNKCWKCGLRFMNEVA